LQPIVPIRIAYESYGGANDPAPCIVEDNKKPPKLNDHKPDDQSHEPAKHIEETARLAGSVETAKDPGKVRRTKD
jgi:hypothetical protein